MECQYTAHAGYFSCDEQPYTYTATCNKKIGPPPKPAPRSNFGSQNWSPLPISVPLQKFKLATANL